MFEAEQIVEIEFVVRFMIISTSNYLTSFRRRDTIGKLRFLVAETTKGFLRNSFLPARVYCERGNIIFFAFGETFSQ
jgi:hypothetical protein